MRYFLKYVLAVLVLISPGIVNAKGTYMTIQATVESFEVVGDSLEIVFSGTMSHVSGNGTKGDQWGLSARVTKTKLVIPIRGHAYFFTEDGGKMQTQNLDDDFDLGSTVYGRKGHQVWITAYSPVIHFSETITQITCPSVALSIMKDTMSDTRVSTAFEEAKNDESDS